MVYLIFLFSIFSANAAEFSTLKWEDLEYEEKTEVIEKQCEVRDRQLAEDDYTFTYCDRNSLTQAQLIQCHAKNLYWGMVEEFYNSLNRDGIFGQIMFGQEHYLENSDCSFDLPFLEFAGCFWKDALSNNEIVMSEFWDPILYSMADTFHTQYHPSIIDLLHVDSPNRERCEVEGMSTLEMLRCHSTGFYQSSVDQMVDNFQSIEDGVRTGYYLQEEELCDRNAPFWEFTACFWTDAGQDSLDNMSDVWLGRQRRRDLPVDSGNAVDFRFLSDNFGDGAAPYPRSMSQIIKAYQVFVWEMIKDQVCNDPELRLLPGEDREFAGDLFRWLAAFTMVKSEDEQLNDRAQRLFSQIKGFAEDPEMRDCYYLEISDSPVANALNMGCMVLVTTRMVEDMSDEELIAVFAHEISHGDQSHVLKQLVRYFSTFFIAPLYVNYEGFIYFATGDRGSWLTGIDEQGFIETFMDHFGAHAPQVELEADIGGARILREMGHSPEILVDALKKLYGLSPEDDVQFSNDIMDGDSRDYPGLSLRVRAIRSLSY